MHASTSLTNLGRTGRFAPSPGDTAILEAISRYNILSAQQVCRLLYKPGSLTYVQTKLKHFTDLNLCQRFFLPRTTRAGSAPSLYTLARKGLNYLRSQGTDVDHRYRPSEKREHGYLFLSHTLAINDVLIASELLGQRVSGITVESMLNESDLKKSPTYIQEGDAKVPVIPDGWVDFRIGGNRQMCLAIELDRGSEEQRRWRRKVRSLLAWANGPYQERFGTPSLTVTVIATPGQKRQLDLLRWTESELVALGQERYADMFRFTSILADAVEPEEFFFSPCWYRPFDRRPETSDRPTLADYQATPLLTLSD